MELSTSLPLSKGERWTISGKSDVKTGECALQRFINMRFRYQVHEIRVPVRSGLTLPGAVDRLVEDFVALYERNFGAGTASGAKPASRC